MAFVLPIPLPESLVTERRVVAKHDFMHAHRTVAFGPDGRGYLHSEMFYNYLRYDQGDEDLSAQIITLLSPTFSITGQLFLEDLHHDLTHAPGSTGKDEYIFNNDIAPLAVTARGEVVFTTERNRTFVYDADIRTRLARFDPLRGEPAGFSDVVAVPGGLVCVRDRDQIGIVANPPPLVDLPALQDVGSVRTALGEGSMRGYLGRFAALDLERILVGQFTGRGRSGWVDHAAFAYTVLGGDGTVVGRFPLGAADTPYGKTNTHDDSYVAHRGLGVWLARSDAALQIVDRDGVHARRIGLAEDERFAAVVPLTLLSVGPNGELVMISKKHHLLVVSDPIDNAGMIEGVLAEVGAVYAAELARLKKAVPYANGRWFGFEPTTPRAAAKATKPKKAKAKTVEEPVSAPAIAASPAEAVGLAPHDLDVLSVFADSLATVDAALGEYINTSIRLHRMDDDDPERGHVEDRTRALLRAHEPRWKETWNQPNTLFGDRVERFCGLPCAVELLAPPIATDAIDRQLAGLPIQTALVKMTMKDIPKLDAMPLLRRITQLIVSNVRKQKLGKPLLAWLANQRLANLTKLNFYGVTATGAGIREVIDPMPALVELTVMSGELSADGVEALAETAAAQRIEKLSLRHNPLGSAVAPVFARFPRLVALDLGAVDIGDDITALPPPHITATKLELADNPRIGTDGLAWLVKAMPGLRDISLPGDLPEAAIGGLLPVAAQLEAIDASWMSGGAKEQLISQIVPLARGLRRLDLTGDGAGFARRIVEHLELDELALGSVVDEDLAALANAQSVKQLALGEGASDAGLGALVRGAKLPKLHTLEIHAHGVTDVGIAAVLNARLPRLSNIRLMYAQIKNANRLIPPRDRPCTLRLFRCEISRAQLETLRHEWGDRLIL